MKSILKAVSLALVLGLAGPHDVQAQPHAGRGGAGVGPVLHELGLTPQQRERLKSLREQQQPKMRAHRKEWQLLQEQLGALDPRAENYRRAVRALADRRAKHARAGTLLHAEFRAGLAEILSDEQLQRMAERRRERRGRRPASRRGSLAQF